MKYLVLKTTDPYINLATEEYLFDTADDDIFMLWQNYNTVVIGKSQNAYTEVDTEYLNKNNIKIARRITGGGAVYHDMGNVNYTFISPRTRAGALDFAYFTAPIIDALASLGVKAELSGRNDLLCGGKKFSGNAQHASGEKILHHGTLLFDSDLSVLSKVLKVDPVKIESKAIKSTRSRVINLKDEIKRNISADEFIELVLAHVAKKYNAKETETPSTEQIEKYYQKYSSHEWIYSDKRYLVEYKVKRKKRYPFGIVCIDLTLEKEKITAARISGDFFGERPIEELESIICGVSLVRNDLTARLGPLNTDEYIYGLSSNDLVELLLEG